MQEMAASAGQLIVHEENRDYAILQNQTGSLK